MKLLHIAPHLGGGVGKAHAAIRAVLPEAIAQTFVLLEEPRDRRHVGAIKAAGGKVVVARNFEHVAGLAAEADIVQFEFWNHPKLFACLARTDFPAIRSVFWSHISGLARPVIQPGLIQEATRFVFTTEASRNLPLLRDPHEAAGHKIAVINSGFGFAQKPMRRWSGGPPRIAYLGTVDFAKMHPGFFDAIDGLDGSDVHVAIWGSFDIDGDVATRARAMRHRGRILFAGHADDPVAALANAEIFFYPLQRDHYGTAENALVEAMSLGLVPVVLNNPAEMAIVRHGETGFVASSIEECSALIQELLVSPDLRQMLSRNAVKHIAETRNSERSAQEFVALWHGSLDEPKRIPNFRTVVGDSPASWFLATQCLPGETWRPSAQPRRKAPSKGELAHFESAFPLDPSLSQLAVFGAAAR